MKHISNERGMASLLFVILALLVFAVVGFAIYNYTNSTKKATQTVATVSPLASASPVQSATPTAAQASTPIDQQLMTDAIKQHYTAKGGLPGTGKFLLYKSEGNYASVGAFPNGVGGGVLLLKKDGGTWVVAYEGQNLTQATATSLGFPDGFVNVGSSSSPVLFTY